MTKRANENSKFKVKQAKTALRAAKRRELLLIVWDSGTSFLDQSQSEVRENQEQFRIPFENGSNSVVREEDTSCVSIPFTFV